MPAARRGFAAPAGGRQAAPPPPPPPPSPPKGSCQASGLSAKPAEPLRRAQRDRHRVASAPVAVAIGPWQRRLGVRAVAQPVRGIAQQLVNRILREQVPRRGLLLLADAGDARRSRPPHHSRCHGARMGAPPRVVPAPPGPRMWLLPPRVFPLARPGPSGAPPTLSAPAYPSAPRMRHRTALLLFPRSQTFGRRVST